MLKPSKIFLKKQTVDLPIENVVSQKKMLIACYCTFFFLNFDWKANLRNPSKRDLIK